MTMAGRVAGAAGGGAGTAGALRRWLLQPAQLERAGRASMDGWRWRRITSVFLVYLSYAVSDMFALHDSPGVIVFGCALIVAFCLLYLWVVPLVAFRGRWELRVPLLLGMTACIAAYLPRAGDVGLPGRDAGPAAASGRLHSAGLRDRRRRHLATRAHRVVERAGRAVVVVRPGAVRLADRVRDPGRYA
ncbi:hypothetical protein [Candidatus Frankia alpina]|uniref:hypothetical protein n=1 Tax=Candidatus Frankia alpina TaxID=2699483 RepID=UPI001F2BF5EB|nr:hypothetical protein [Candidatus Frankia alpina]